MVSPGKRTSRGIMRSLAGLAIGRGYAPHGTVPTPTGSTKHGTDASKFLTEHDEHLLLLNIRFLGVFFGLGLSGTVARIAQHQISHDPAPLTANNALAAILCVVVVPCLVIMRYASQALPAGRSGSLTSDELKLWRESMKLPTGMTTAVAAILATAVVATFLDTEVPTSAVTAVLGVVSTGAIFQLASAMVATNTLRSANITWRMTHRLRKAWRVFWGVTLATALLGTSVIFLMHSGNAKDDDMTCKHVAKTTSTFTCKITK